MCPLTIKGGKTLMKLKKGDNVMVLSGNNKGKTGEIVVAVY